MPSTDGTDNKGSSGSSDAKKVAQNKNVPRKPAKYGHYERTVVDYVRTATAKNVWYYRYVSYRQWNVSICLNIRIDGENMDLDGSFMGD